ncbi:MFS transporter [Corynebacterium sp. S7]
MDKFRYVCIMIGGFLGPFAGQSLSVVLPEFAADFGISLELASLTMTAYMLPLAVTMLFSSYLVRNLRPAPVIRTAYMVIAVAAIVLVFTPVWWLFLVAFIVAAIGNAFTAPLLQQVLKQITPDDKLGQALGTYAAMQSFGLFSAPLVAGVTSLVSWRLMYVFLAVFAVVIVIVIVRVPDVPATPPAPGSRRFKLTWPVVRAMLTLLSVGTGVIGMSFIISLYIGDRFGAGPVTRGAIVMIGGLTAFIFARYVGGLADRHGPRPVLVGGLIVAAAAILAISVSPWMILIAVFWGVAVLAVQGTQVSVNMLVLRAPGGTQMLSTIQAFRFFGNSLTPILILPLYNIHAWLGFLGAAVILLVMAVVNIVGQRTTKSAS